MDALLDLIDEYADNDMPMYSTLITSLMDVLDSSLALSIYYHRELIGRENIQQYFMKIGIDHIICGEDGDEDDEEDMQISHSRNVKEIPDTTMFG